MKKIFGAAFFALFSITALSAAAIAENVMHGGDIVYVKPVKTVTFSHDAHVTKSGLACEMCHPRTFEMNSLAAQENPDFVMKSLYEGKYCGVCHNGTIAFASDTRCASCHTGVKALKKKAPGGAKH